VLKEFKEFAMRGNMLDLAVGVIIGAAFGGVVTSLVNDLLMPPLGRLVAGWIFRASSSISAINIMIRWQRQKPRARQRLIMEIF